MINVYQGDPRVVNKVIENLELPLFVASDRDVASRRFREETCRAFWCSIVHPDRAVSATKIAAEPTK